MKGEITLGARGVRALVALCAHCEGNGNFAVDGKWIASVLIEVAGARSDVRAWRDEDLAASYSRSCSNASRRLADAKAEIEADR